MEQLHNQSDGVDGNISPYQFPKSIEVQVQPLPPGESTDQDGKQGSTNGNFGRIQLAKHVASIGRQFGLSFGTYCGFCGVLALSRGDIQGLVNNLRTNLSIRFEMIRPVWGGTRCNDERMASLPGRIRTNGGNESLTPSLFRASCRSCLHPAKCHPEGLTTAEALPHPSQLNAIAFA